MRQSVLLTHSNHLFNDAKQREKMQPYPPLQTLLAAAVLREAGVQTAVCDVTLREPHAALRQAIEETSPDLVVVCEDDFNYLTKMCLGHNRELAFWTAHLARDHGCRVAVHGSDASDHPQAYLAAGFDAVAIGETEETLLELALGHAREQITGLAFLSPDGERVHRTPLRPLRKSLDGLPHPAWDLIDVEEYRRAWMNHHGAFTINLVASRGCPFRCNWCAKPIWGNGYRASSPMRVAEEMELVKRRYASDRIWFADDIFGLSAKWTNALADAVEQRDAALPFKMQSRCDLMTRDTVADLQRAGCAEVWLGAESGSQRILDAMEKGIRTEQIIQASNNLRQHDIRIGLFLQFGYPGESWEDIARTVDMVRATKPDDVGISVTYPLPGTKLHQVVSAQMRDQAHWQQSGDLAMMFHGAYSTEFYRALADAIHKEVREPANRGAIDSAWAAVRAVRPAEMPWRAAS